MKKVLLRLLSKYDEVICVTLPYALSRGTENALARAMKDIETEHPSLSVRNRVYQYQPRELPWGLDFWIHFSGLPMKWNFEF